MDEEKKEYLLTIIPFEKLQFTEADLIGKGAYGSVFKGKLDGVEVAIKKMHSLSHIEGYDACMRREILGEIEKYFKLGKHQNVAHCLGLAEKNDIFYLVMEYFPLGDLHSIIKSQMMHHNAKETTKFTMEDKLRISLGIAEALQFCHEQGLIHLDLRPSDVLLERVFREDGGMVYNARVCELGLSCPKNAFRAHRMGAGTDFVPPEFLEVCRKAAVSITEKCDVYSLGMTIWCIFSESLPSNEIDDLQLRPGRGEKLAAKRIEKMVRQCCEAEPGQRCGVEEVVVALRKCLDACSRGVTFPISGERSSQEDNRWEGYDFGEGRVTNYEEIIEAMENCVSKLEDFDSYSKSDDEYFDYNVTFTIGCKIMQFCVEDPGFVTGGFETAEEAQDVLRRIMSFNIPFHDCVTQPLLTWNLGWREIHVCISQGNCPDERIW